MSQPRFRPRRKLRPDEYNVNPPDEGEDREDLFVMGAKIRVYVEEYRNEGRTLIYFRRSSKANCRVRIPNTRNRGLLAHTAVEIWELLLSALPLGMHLECLGFLMITPKGEAWQDYSNHGPGWISRQIWESPVPADWLYIDFRVVPDSGSRE